MRTLALIPAFLCLLLATGQSVHAFDCAALERSKLPDTTIESAQNTPAGPFTPDNGTPIKQIAAFCRVTGFITPTADSHIQFEVWLPEDWNGRYLGVGNGGFAGTIGYGGLASNVNAGYATASTDTGHQGEAGDASWAYKHPEKVVDFGYRALHLTTLNAKALIKQFYGRDANHSYFSSCSDGGREALMEAQRFPDDFDGILAGAPANAWTRLVTNGLGVTQTLVTPSGYISGLKLNAIHEAVLDACDAADGVKDGVINDPSRCHFDPAVMLCGQQRSSRCLTASQIETLRDLYAGSTDPKGTHLFPGFSPGGEVGWSSWIVGFGPGGGFGYVYMNNYFRYMVYDDPAWNPFKASIGEALKLATSRTAQALDAVDPDLRPFARHGGKLILYHGWNDAAISPQNTINYFDEVRKKMGPDQELQFVRLYMVPGMEHCAGGGGANSFGQGGPSKTDSSGDNILATLEQWVESGKAPAQITATKYKDNVSTNGVAFTRLLCPYPQIAKYKGSGDTNNASSFICGVD